MSGRGIVIGVGNSVCGDDAAGVAVARRVRERAGDRVRVLEAAGEPATLIDAWDGARVAVLIDAARSGGPAGEVRRIDARDGLVASGLSLRIAPASSARMTRIGET